MAVPDAAGAWAAGPAGAAVEAFATGAGDGETGFLACRSLAALAPFFRDLLNRCQQPWREVVALAVGQGIPVPAFSAALAYYDSLRSPRLSANLLQAQRDFFGAHGYERVDQPEGRFFHTEWPEVID